MLLLSDDAMYVTFKKAIKEKKKRNIHKVTYHILLISL